MPGITTTRLGMLETLSGKGNGKTIEALNLALKNGKVLTTAVGNTSRIHIQ